VTDAAETNATDPTADKSATLDKPVHLEDGAALDAFVAEHDLALVDLYTKGCTLCQAIEPVVGNVARATEAAVGMVNPKHDLELVETYDVRSVPTLLLFADGELVGRMADGFQETEAVVEFVESRGEA
jgi:thioredoxin-like negative regulator of GroEL